MPRQEGSLVLTAEEKNITKHHYETAKDRNKG